MTIRNGFRGIVLVSLLVSISACQNPKKDEPPVTGPKSSYGQAVQKGKDLANKVEDRDKETAKQADALKD